MTTKTQDAAEQYEAERAKLEDLKSEAATLDHRRVELEQRIAAPRDFVDEAALAELDGETLELPPAPDQELSEVRKRLRVARRKVELQKDRVTKARAAWSEAECDQAEPAIREAVQDVAEHLLAVGDATDTLHDLLADLDARGVTRLHRFPGLRLFPLRSSEPGSRLNDFLDELERNYGVEVEREARDAVLEVRKRAHLKNEERKRKTGGTIAAGPDGVVEYARGGAVRRRA